MTRDVVALLLVFRFVFLLCSARNSAVQKGTSTSGTSVTAGIWRFRKAHPRPVPR